MKETTGLHLKKPDITDFYNVEDFNFNADIVDAAIEELKKSQSSSETAIDGKADKGHKHTVSEITDFPSALPASGGNADTVDGKHAADFAAANQSHNYAASGHTHDDRYFTETEVNTLLAGKAAANHSHSYATSSHTHDDRYYTESEVNNLLAGKAASNHTHNYAAASHTHTASQVSGLPTRLPANGGNSDTVDGVHVVTTAALGLHRLASGTAAPTTSNCPTGCWYGKH